MEENADQMSQLCRLCREGRLFEVERWCREGKPVDFTHRNPRLTPIGIAIDKGFHSLVEVLLRAGVSGSDLPLRQAVRHTAIIEAVWQGHLEILKKIGIDPQCDNLDELLNYAARSKNAQLVQHLIEHGADIDNKRGGESPLKASVWSLWVALDIVPSWSRAAEAVEVIKALTSSGAKFGLQDAASKELRRCLLKMEWDRAFELMKHLKSVGAAEDGVFAPVLKHPKMRPDLPYRAKAIQRLFPEPVSPRRRKRP